MRDFGRMYWSRRCHKSCIIRSTLQKIQSKTPCSILELGGSDCINQEGGNCALFPKLVFMQPHQVLDAQKFMRSPVSWERCVWRGQYLQVPTPSFGTEFGRLLENGEGADVTFKVEDEEMKAHRLVLSTRSPVFAGMLRADMRENQEGVVTVQDVRAPVFRALLWFIYTDSLPEVSD